MESKEDSLFEDIGTKISSICPECGAQIDPSNWKAEYQDPWTGIKTSFLSTNKKPCSTIVSKKWA